MSQYDQEDYINEDEIPDFHDEGELDDYLNDEEYDLMNQVLPEVKEGMKDYQGWTTFDLKLAILDSDFGSNEALLDLKKQYKKKKNNVDNAMGKLKISGTPTPTLSPTISSINSKNKTSNNPQLANDEIEVPSDDDLDGEVSSSHWIKEEVDEKIIKAYKRAIQPTKPRNPIDVKEYIDTQAKPHLNFVVLGHVDAGKSTLMGRLLYDIGAVDKNKIRKLKKESEQIGKGSFHLAWVMDQTTEERERGVTVSICTSDFKTPSANFTIVDAPGHRDFVPNAIAGVSQADVAVLSVDCGTDAFESGFNLDGQTKEHTLLARSMDISTIVVAMNKMDTVDWSATRFFQIQDELMDWFKKIGYKEDQIKWIPLSGFSGEGVYKIPYPEEQNWYDGPSLVETLEAVATKVNDESRKEVLDKPFVFSILEVSSSKKNDESILAGKVESGSIQPGETITIYPSEQSCLVDKILTGRELESTNIAVKGEFVTLKLRQSHPKDIEGGDLCGSVGYDIKSGRKFKIRLSTFQMNRPLLPGTSVMLFRGVYEQPARINKLLALIDRKDPSKVVKKKVKHLPSNKTAVVEIELTERRRWIPMVTIDENKHIGRVIIRKDGRSVATGAILEVE